MRRIFAIAAIIGVNLLIGSFVYGQANPPAAQTPADLFSDAPDFPDPPLSATTTRARAVTLNLAALSSAAASGGRLIVTPFDGISASATFIQQAHALIPGGAEYIGTLDGGGTVVIASGGGDTRGAIVMAGREYLLTPIGSNTFALEERVPLPDEGDDAIVPPAPPADIGAALPPDQPFANAQIDWLVAYTDDTRAAYGSTAATLNGITNERNLINQAYVNSGVAITLNVVHTVEVDYTQGSGIETDLYRITNGGDGFLDNLHTLRNTYYADLVTLIVSSDPSYNGIAWLMNTNYASNPVTFAQYGYSVVTRTALNGAHSTAHELGHNMGLEHNRGSASTSPIQPYAYGWQNPSGLFRDIMSYNCSGGCPRINYFSSSTLTYSGQALGNATNDAARALNFSGPYVAQFRAAPTASLAITLTVQGRTGTSGSAFSFPVQVVVKTTGGTAVYNSTPTSNTSGVVTLVNLPVGAMNVWVKGGHTLAARHAVTLAAGANTLTTALLREGDSNGDNTVTVADFSILAANFGVSSSSGSFNPQADLNRNGVVNVADFSLMAGNFGQSGPAAP